MFLMNRLTSLCWLMALAHSSSIFCNPIQVDLIFQITFSLGMAVTMLIQGKEGFYHDHYSMNVFFLF
jgi:uncharacterized protein (DUF2062 family)